VARRTRSDYATGLLLATFAYATWGLFPLFFPLLKPASALEILAHRIFWTLLFLLLLLSVRHLWGSVRQQLARRQAMGLLAIAAVAVSSNWALYIWAVNSGHVVEGSFGYFINPLVAVLFGVSLLGERLRRLQWASVALGALAVLELTYAYGRPPWIALGLALTFALYGLVKKVAKVPAIEALAIETTYLIPFSLAYLLYLSVSAQSTFGHSSVGNTALLALTGVVTALPLLAFGGSVNRIPLSTVGLLQYITPVLQFLCGVLIYREVMTGAGWIGFAIVWVAVMVMSFDAIRTARDPEWVGGLQRVPAASSHGSNLPD